MQIPNPSPIEAHDPPGKPGEVDDTLIEWMLSLTPLERLQALQRFVESAYLLRHASNPQSAQDPPSADTP